MTKETLPSVFLERFQKIIPEDYFDASVRTFWRDRPLSVRVNSLKVSKEKIVSLLESRQISFSPVSWYADALVVDGAHLRNSMGNKFIDEGLLYIQSLSSMLPALVLNPQSGERVLDMCAAPGGKTTQMAALMKNQGGIVAVEPIRDRFYRLKSVVAQLGADIVTFKRLDARRWRFGDGAFDKILIDAPCSSEGRFHTNEPKTFAYWSLRKIKEMARKQRGLLLTASRILKPGGVLVYSTCTFAPEENEGTIDWLLRKTGGSLKVMPVHFQGVKTYAAVGWWQGKKFNEQVKYCVRVLPEEQMEGFFMAKLIKAP